MAILSPNARTTATEVKEIIETCLTDAEVNAFINSANVVVTANLASSGMTPDLLTEIEKWLSAHFLSMKDQRVKSESVGGEWSVTYQGNTSEGLGATLYGQQVLLLDQSGILSTASSQNSSFEIF